MFRIRDDELTVNDLIVKVFFEPRVEVDAQVKRLTGFEVHDHLLCQIARLFVDQTKRHLCAHLCG